MSRYIDTKWLEDNAKEYSLGYYDYDEYAVPLSALDSAPSIDIVRCGECIHNGSYDTDCPFGWRNGEWNMPKPCDYCSYGEREGE